MMLAAAAAAFASDKDLARAGSTQRPDRVCIVALQQSLQHTKDVCGSTPMLFWSRHLLGYGCSSYVAGEALPRAPGREFA
jgi:hypothetical protein